MGEKFKLAGITAETLGPIWANKSMNMAVVAKALNVSVTGLHLRAGVLNLPARGNSKKPIDEALFVAMWSSGVDGEDIAAHFGFASYRSVWVLSKRLNLGRKRRTKHVDRVTIKQFMEQRFGTLMLERAQSDRKAG
jgi:hypothetical protein